MAGKAHQFKREQPSTSTNCGTVMYSSWYVLRPVQSRTTGSSLRLRDSFVGQQRVVEGRSDIACCLHFEEINNDTGKEY
ncbi:hypothetical protein CC2G_014097 [Coprinopsis cinerea AmutBmut pab1-1]|nr:hypothetical protein CC2G_014097 [Coprinopsis cinerea AmutBmut pab1-1]